MVSKTSQAHCIQVFHNNGAGDTRSSTTAGPWDPLLTAVLKPYTVINATNVSFSFASRAASWRYCPALLHQQIPSDCFRSRRCAFLQLQSCWMISSLLVIFYSLEKEAIPRNWCCSDRVATSPTLPIRWCLTLPNTSSPSLALLFLWRRPGVWQHASGPGMSRISLLISHIKSAAFQNNVAFQNSILKRRFTYVHNVHTTWLLSQTYLQESWPRPSSLSSSFAISAELRSSARGQPSGSGSFYWVSGSAASASNSSSAVRSSVAGSSEEPGGLSETSEAANAYSSMAAMGGGNYTFSRPIIGNQHAFQ